MNSNEEINKKFDEIKKRTTKEPEPEERDDSEKKLGAGTAMFVGGERSDPIILGDTCGRRQ